jgi:pyruvate/2-oxoglutarate dehydrogenase complex dihydrolipoamide acyltransferase (E2) component
MSNQHSKSFPRTRIGTFDVGALSRTRHHVVALLECDVTRARAGLKDKRRQGHKASFTAYLIKAIADTVAKHPDVAGYLQGRRRRITFDDVNISILVEKELAGDRVPVPLVIEQASEQSVESITARIETAKAGRMAAGEVVLNRKTSAAERLYYHLPGVLRRAAWRYMLGRPKLIFGKMGNVAVTSLGMLGQVGGWFIHTSVHPLSIGIGAVVPKPWVVDGQIEIRDILHFTLLMDHDVVDGAPMIRFAADLVARIEA